MDDSRNALAPSLLKHAVSFYRSSGSSTGLDQFLERLSDPASSATPSGHTDLAQPIPHYYISTSHNTYLTGNQLWSKSSTAAYKEVLVQGCRCIEIDVWDGESPDSSETDEPEHQDGNKAKSFVKKQLAEISDGDKVKSFVKKQLGRIRAHSKSDATKSDDPVDPSVSREPSPDSGRGVSPRSEPRVLHGHTATKEISFREVCRIVQKYAFQASDLPLIVSLEVHCSAPQQEIMVEIMSEYWKGFLSSIPEGYSDATPPPALETLKRKILIKVKYSAKEPSKPDSEQDSSADEGQSEAVKKGQIIGALSQMGIWTRAYHFHDLEQPEATIPTHVFALSEKKLKGLCEEQPDALFDHNMRYLMRAYPKATRIRSTNVDPAPLWRFGIQLVALNMQTVDAATMLNHAMFEGTGGWVLKPESYRPQSEGAPATARFSLDLTIKLLAAQNIAVGADTPNVYVKCELHLESEVEREKSQIPDDGEKKSGRWKLQSRVVGNREPDFAGEAFEFHGAKDVVPELSFVRLLFLDRPQIKC